MQTEIRKIIFYIKDRIIKSCYQIIFFMRFPAYVSTRIKAPNIIMTGPEGISNMNDMAKPLIVIIILTIVENNIIVVKRWKICIAIRGGIVNRAITRITNQPY